MPSTPGIDKSRLDVLIYSHDGRGFGHVSRGVTIGMALRRLFPKLKVLFISGFKQTATLVGPCPLEWMKLPSYETRIIEGKSKGRLGNANIKNCYLGPARASIIESIITNFKPRCVLVDHDPPGKRDELLPSLKITKETDTIWILGIRAVVGEVATIWSELSKNAFMEHYHSLLWYGDEKVLGKEIPHAIGEYFATNPIVTGYVSRFLEMRHWTPYDNSGKYAGTIAVPWLSLTSLTFLQNLNKALFELGEGYGRWKIFTDLKKIEAEAKNIKLQFDDIPYCSVENVSDRYLASLANSRVAVIYGGYNSMTDIMAAKVPSVVIVRGMNDREQEEHVRKISQLKPNSINVLKEAEANWNTLAEKLEKQLNIDVAVESEIRLNGAAVSAEKIVEPLELFGYHPA
jgi:predicted glycosyltransferase